MADEFNSEDLIEVQIMETTERYTEAKLSDGSTLRIKVAPLGAYRRPGEYDPDGNPVYTVRHNVIVLVDAPARLRDPPE